MVDIELTFRTMYAGYAGKFYPFVDTLRVDAPAMEKDIESITGTVSPIFDRVMLDLSPDVKRMNKNIKYSDVYNGIMDIFGDIEDIGEYPPGYDWARSRVESIPSPDADYNDISKEDCRDDCNGLRDVGNIMSGSEEGYGWAVWADDHGYPDLAKKIKEILGKLWAMNTFISVSYSKARRTIIMYYNVLGPIQNKDDEDRWRAAFICGLFYAYYSDACEKSRVNINGKLEESLCAYVENIFTEYLGNHRLARKQYNTWRNNDMKYWPYSGALYFKDIELKNKYNKDLFKRTYLKSLTNQKEAYDDLKAFYRTYEGYAFK